jgi:hypothetical protein
MEFESPVVNVMVVVFVACPPDIDCVSAAVVAHLPNCRAPSVIVIQDEPEHAFVVLERTSPVPLSAVFQSVMALSMGV